MTTGKKAERGAANQLAWREVAAEGLWQIAWRQLRHNVTGMAGLIGLLLIALMTVTAPWISPYEPTEMDFQSVKQPPGSAHLFGTDDLGRDVLSRVMWGGRESIRVGFIAISLAMAGGVLVGTISGYYGGLLDSVTQRIVEVFMAFPTILLLLSIVAVLGPGLTTVLIAIGISLIPAYSRIVRGSVLAAKNYEYVTAARLVGATNGRIMIRHILPNVLSLVIIYGTLGLGSSILLTAGLSYIGLGAQPPSPEWGSMLLYGRNLIRTAWWMSVFPGLAIFVVVLCINLLGDGLRDALDPKLRM